MILAAVALAAGAVVPSADQQRMAEQARRTLTFAFAGDVMMLPIYSHFLALAFPCTEAYKVCMTNRPLFPLMAN